MVSKSGCVGWLKKRTNLEKTLLSLSSLLLLTLLLMILIGVTYHGKNSDVVTDEPICRSNECIKTAGDVLSSMKPTTDSCINPFDFACGRYGQDPGETLSISKRSTESVYFSLKRIMQSKEKLNIDGLDDVRSFYNSCVKFGSFRQNVGETGEALLNLMDEMEIGIWPLIDPLYDHSKFTLELTLAGLILLDVPVVFQMEIVPDENLAGSHLIKISPGGPRESGRSPSDIRSDVHLRSSVLTSFLLLGASSASTDTQDILSVDSSFAAIEQDKGVPCGDIKVLAPHEAVSELNRLMPEMDWDIIMTKIREATGLSRPFTVELHCKQKIRDYVVHLNDLSLRSETNYLGWRFFSKFVEHVVPTFEKSEFGTDEIVSRWKVCLELMEKFASPILADVLRKKLINKEIEDEVTQISNAALVSTQRVVSRARWLSDSQKSRIREKVTRIRVRYPFQVTTNNQLRPLQIPLVDVRNFTAVVIKSQRKWVIQKFRRLSLESEPFTPPESWTPLLTSRADSPSSDFTALVYFDKIINPFIRLWGPKWMNYGGFGVAVAREISEVLMSMNAEESREERTELWNVWSRSRNSSVCVSTRLGKNEVLTPDTRERLIKDIFSDQSSIEIAYETAKALSSLSKSHSLPGLDFSNEKAFFLAHAQTLCEADEPLQVSKHIPAKDRLNAAFLNFEAFTKVFHCAPTSSQCEIWA